MASTGGATGSVISETEGDVHPDVELSLWPSGASDQAREDSYRKRMIGYS